MLILSIFSLGSFTNSIMKFIVFVEKFTYVQLITLFQSLIMYSFLKLYFIIFKIDSSTTLSRMDYIKYILSIAILLSIDIITSNIAYSYLDISVITVLKSSSLVIIYLLSVTFGLKELRIVLLISILTILGGILISVKSFKIDSIFGLILLSISVVASSFKWVFINLIIKNTSITNHVLLLHIYKMSILIIIFPSLFIDLTNIINDYNYNLITNNKIYLICLLLTLASISNIFLLLAEYILISHTSSVTLSIVNIGKEASVLIIGTVFFKEEINLNSAIGIVISMIGTIMYGYLST